MSRSGLARNGLGALAVAVAIASSATARADESAADLVARGIELRERHRDEEALVLFRRAHAIAPEPRTRVQVGLAEHALGMWAAAERDLEAGLASRDDPWIAKNSRALEAALAVVRNHLGSVEVRADVDAAELFIDGAPSGRLPLARAARVSVGTHRLEVRAPGFASSARTIEITPGSMLRETFELARETTRPSSPSEPASEPPAASSPGSAQRTVGWIIVGVGVTAGAFSGVSFAVREGETRSYNDDASCPGRANPVQPVACAEKLDAADRWLTIGIATAVTAGMVVVGGLIIALTASRDGSRQAVSCTVGGCGVRF